MIGRLLVQRLAGYQIVRLDRLDIKDENYVCADVSDSEALTRGLVPHGRITAIVHLAADSSVKASWESVLKDNIIATRNVFEFARQNDVEKIVFASSNQVTAKYEDDPPSSPWKRESPPVISVDMPVRPRNYYGVSKLFGEALGRYFSEAYNISVICLRIGTVLKHDNPESDERCRSTWLSHRDLVHLVEQSLKANVRFGIYYGVSANDRKFWDISNAERDLKYKSEDNAELRFRRN